jgi:hypothetical protein
MNLPSIVKIAAFPIVVASLCCLSPIILVLFGIGTVGFAASLADTLYGEYRWHFRIAGLVVMIIALALYFYRSQNICTLDQAKRRCNEIVNTLALTLIVGVFGYVLFLYGIVHYLGVWLSLWS